MPPNWTLELTIAVGRPVRGLPLALTAQRRYCWAVVGTASSTDLHRTQLELIGADVRTLSILAPWHKGWASCGWLDGGLLALPAGDALWLVDIDRIMQPVIDLAAAPLVARFDDVTAAQYGDDELVTVDRASTIRRYERAYGWLPSDAFALPHALKGTSSPPHRLERSATGRYLLVHTDHAHLLEVGTWRLVRSIELVAPSFGHAAFTRLPSGDDVLLIAAPSYMGLQMIDCQSGDVVHEYKPISGWDFCHTGFELSADGSRLFAYGCVWAAPPSSRIYDARPWTGGGTVAASGFPLRIVFERAEGEIHGCGDVLPIAATPGSDGAVGCVTAVSLAEVPASGSEEERDWRANASEAERRLSSELQAAAAAYPFAVVIRRVDPRDGRVEGWTVHPYASAREGKVSVHGDDVLIIGSARVQRVDSVRGICEDLGPAPPRPSGASGSAMMRADRSVLVDVVRPPPT